LYLRRIIYYFFFDNISIHDLIDFAEEIAEQRSFEGLGCFGDSSFCYVALPLSMDFGGIRTYFREII
jgi:hypothetical protein